eukprot:1121591-Pelagomonas_calceolata.AAC.1
MLLIARSIHSREPTCWTAPVSDGFQGLRHCDSFVQALRQGAPIPLQEFTDDLRHRLRAVWKDVDSTPSEGVNPRGTYCKLATYQSLLAVPFGHNVHALAHLPWHMHLDLSPHVMRKRLPFQT